MSLRSPSSPFLLACLAALALCAPGADAAKQHRPRGPVLLTVRCTASCKSQRQVAIGGALRLSGHHLVRGLIVVFPSASGKAPPASAPLRLSRTGLVVTVPTRAGTGLVHVKDNRGHRSNAIGPIVVLHPAVVKKPAPVVTTTPAGPSPFDDSGMWIWELPKSSGGSVATIIALAHAHQIGTLFIKSSDGPSNYWSQFTPALIATLHAAGLKVCAWQYVYGSDPSGEAALGVRATKAGADCLLIDAESEYEGRYSAAQTYITNLRAGVGPSYPIALAGFPYVDYHPAFPYSVLLGPGGAQFNAPQMYWKDIGVSVDTVFAHTYTNNTIYQRPIYPLGQTFQSPSTAEIVRFRQLALAYGAGGVSWWDWQETSSALWTALGQPLPALSGFTPSQAMPVLKSGAKGDQVVWMQEHLAMIDPGLKIDGVFGASTVTAVKAFQTSRVLPATGATDALTWQALLALTPAMADWNASSAHNARAATASRTARTDGARAPRSARLPAKADEISRVG